jgi:hypothetical protein
VVTWIPVDDSERVVAIAFDADGEAILVRFPNGVEWSYEACPRHLWEDFIAPGTSKGRFISEVLNHQPHHRYG